MLRRSPLFLTSSSLSIIRFVQPTSDNNTTTTGGINTSRLQNYYSACCSTAKRFNSSAFLRPVASPASVERPATSSNRVMSHNPVSTMPLILDAPLVVPIVSDVLLSDLNWQQLTELFPGLVHAEVQPENAEPLFRITTTLRTVALLPVCTTTARETTPRRWVPFIIDTGARETYFTQATIDALKLNTVDHIDVFTMSVNFHKSTGHFDDINLLGTDVLRNCQLTIDYPTNRVSLVPRVRQALSGTYWVQQLDPATRNPVAACFQVSVTGEIPHIDGLKDAIKTKRSVLCAKVDAADISILNTNKDEYRKMSTALEQNNEEAPYYFLLPS